MSIKKLRKRSENRYKRYGMHQSEFDFLMLKQGFECPICNKQLHSGNSHIDHNHDNEFTRGILCSECNTGLGKFKDDPDILDSAYRYLKNHSDL